MLAAPIASSAAESPLEEQVLHLVNFARTDPAAYAQTLQTFRTYFHDRNFTLPGATEDNATEEGVAAVDDAIAFLAKQDKLTTIDPAPILEAGAAEHTAEQAADGSTGHEGHGGSSPADRVRRHGGGFFVAEVIEYGAVDAVDVVRQLLVDDGVPDRGHRGILFDPRLRFAGVSCGTHPEFRTMCVIDFAATANASAPLSAHGGRFGRP